MCCALPMVAEGHRCSHATCAVVTRARTGCDGNRTPCRKTAATTPATEEKEKEKTPLLQPQKQKDATPTAAKKIKKIKRDATPTAAAAVGFDVAARALVKLAQQEFAQIERPA